QRLLSEGKPYKVAVTACMRKLLTISNARMRDYFAENDTAENDTAENDTAENGIRTA
ncbi:TPA: IS110 family transposase, partial [Neisseria meningitidis]